MAVHDAVPRFSFNESPMRSAPPVLLGKHNGGTTAAAIVNGARPLDKRNRTELASLLAERAQELDDAEDFRVVYLLW